MDEKERILIVDDDENTRRILALIFGKNDYETETAGTGQEAIKKTQGRFFNVALLDIRLPDKEGLELIAPLKEIHPDIVVIMITGYASLETAVQALNDGASAYITKPLNMDDVLATVREALKKQHLVREKLRAEEALRKNEEKYRSLYKLSKDGIVFSDMQGNILDANQAFLYMLGYTKEEYKKLTYQQMTPKKWHKKEKDIIKNQIIARGYSDEYEKEYIKKNGTVFPVTIRVWLINNEQGKPIGTWAIVRDITESKRIEEKLRQTIEELKRSNKDLEQFAYVASHDLQEPLRMVASYVRLLERRYKGKLDSDADEFIAYAAEGATRMQRMINDLLAFSRVETKGKKFKQMDCAHIFGQAIANLRGAIEKSGAVVTNSNLPMIKADKYQLIQLFQNLIDNAIKFSSNEPPRVHVGAKKKGKEWLFSVQDNGIGIDPQYAKRIFMIFQRLHEKKKYPGTGVGLAICKRIVERHSGRIWEESEPGKGSTFFFTIPRKGGK